MNPTNVYQLKITLEGIGPPIWRRIQVSGATTLDRLHTVIQNFRSLIGFGDTIPRC